MLSPNVTQSRSNFTILGSCIFVGLLSACNQPFDPRGDLDKKLVVFSILSTDRDVQFARVERTYLPAGYDPGADTTDKTIRNAVVTIGQGGLTLRLRDTTLTRSDPNENDILLRAYVASSFKPNHGGSYILRVEADGFGPVSESVLVPMKPALDIDPISQAVLDRPAKYEKDASIMLSTTLGYGAYGYRIRLFVDYEVLKGTEWVEERVEIPTAFTLPNSEDYSYVNYPNFTRSSANNRASGNHKNNVYSRTLIEVAYRKYGSTKIIFNRAVVQLLQADRNLYRYYLATHSYGDPHSIRLDEPIFSGVAGGVGVMGAYTLDSLVHILPENFAYSHY
ncbi:MAG: DUF4249 family protein [Ignavibacteriales bacterium]|nr:DUF4249 family protein [Ignavibacteriales bacterium]